MSFTNLLSFVGFFFAIVLGYILPRRMGWLLIFFIPIMTAANIILIPSNFFPLTSIRFAFGATIGILLSNFLKDIPPKVLFKLWFVKLLIIFALIRIIVSFNDKLLPTISSYIPGLFFAIVLPFIIIKNEQDLLRLIKIFIWIGGLIGMLAIIEYFTGFNIYDIFAKINEDPSFVGGKIWYRGGFQRVNGICGNSVDTGYMLAFLFPLTVWYATRNKIITKIPLLLLLVGLILVQTRAVFVAVILAIIIISFQLLTAKKIGIKNKVSFFLRGLVVISLVSILLLITFPDIYKILNQYIEETTTYFSLYAVHEKVSRIPRAINYFIQNPILGYGSPSSVYYDLMESDDIPSPLIYLLSGGITMGLVYIMIIITLPLTTFRLQRNRLLSIKQRQLIIFVGGALVAGVIVVFSNSREGHFLMMFMLYISVYKIYFLKKKFIPAYHAKSISTKKSYNEN